MLNYGNNKLLLFCSIFFFLILSQLSAKDTTVVFCNDGHTNPYHVEWLAGFEDALQLYNKELGGINGYWRSAFNLEIQLEQVNEEIEKGVDILFVNPIELGNFIPLIKKAKEKGIIWVSVHNYMKEADYNFLLGDLENGYNQGLALATYFNGNAKVAIMQGRRGTISGEERVQGILKAFAKYPNIEVIAQEPADWNSSLALNIAEKWLNRFPELDAISTVTDTYIYPSKQLAKEFGRDDLLFFGYDGDIDILNSMKTDQIVKADILLSANREGWNFVQLAYKLANNIPIEKIYNFFTPLVLTKETYSICLKNGFPRDIKVYFVEDALELAKNGKLEYGPQTIRRGK